MPKKKLTSPKVKRPIGWSSHGWSVESPGRMIFVSGLTARDDKTGEVCHVGDGKGQTQRIFEQLGQILAEDGATLADVVKITVFIADRSHYPGFVEARRKVFEKDPPATSVLMISGLVDERNTVEIEATAFVSE